VKNEAEIFLNPLALKDVLNRFRVVDYSMGWTVVEEFNRYYVKEFDSYGVLLDYSSDPDVVDSFSSFLRSVDRIRYYLMKPGFFSESLSVIIRDDELTTLPSLQLEWFPGQDLVNSLLRPAGLEIRRDEDGYSIIVVKIGRPLSPEELDRALDKLGLGLSLYQRIREAQEDVALKVTKDFLSHHLK
jgi:hypothetical protein